MSSLNSSQLKLGRAKHHLKALGEMLKGFAASEPHAFMFDCEPEGHECVIRASIRQPIPDDFGLIVGEFTHNARSALDYIVYQISTLPLNDDARRRLQFPIFDTPDGYTSRKNAYLAGVDAANRTIIEGYQPYQGVGEPLNDPLGFLNEINNMDKHRLIPVVAVRSRFTATNTSGDTTECGWQLIGDGRVTKDGAPIAKFTAMPNTQMNVKLNATTTIHFGESHPRIKGRDVLGTLILICDRVEEIIGRFR